MFQSFFKWGRNVLKSLSLSAIIVDLSFAVFIFQAIKGASDYCLAEAGAGGELLETLLMVVGGIFATANTICDCAIANPVEDTEALLSRPAVTLDSRLKKSSGCERGTVKTLIGVSQVIAHSAYVVGAAADAVGFAYLSPNPVYRWCTGIPTTLLGVLFYNLITQARINNHVYEFIHRLFDGTQSMLVNIAKAPLRSLEVMILVSSDSLYRGITFGYIMRQLLFMIFERQEDDPVNFYYISAAATASMYMTFFSRTLTVHQEIFNPKFAMIPPDVLQQTKISKAGLTVDVIMTALRASPVALLIIRHGPTDAFLNYLCSGLAFASVASHNFYVRYYTRLSNTALHQPETARLLPEKGIADENSDDAISLFSAIEEKQKTATMRHAVTVLNTCGRVGRSAAFLGFLVALNETAEKIGINLDLKFIDLLCIHQLWGNPTFEDEALFYQNTLVKNFAYYRTKFLIESKVHHSGWLPTFWRSSRDYPVEVLQQAKQLLGNDGEHNEANSSP